MAAKPKLFWDSSGLIAGLLSPNRQNPARQLIRLGEACAVSMYVSREVLRDAEHVVGRRDTEALRELALWLDDADFGITLDPGDQTVEDCISMTGYRPDARVLAAAVECDADLFITHDKVHFLGNPLIGPPDTRLRVVTPHEALEWCRARILERKNELEQDDTSA